METFESGAHAYHATIPTDSLSSVRHAMVEARAYGLEKLREDQQCLGATIRAMLAEKGFFSVAAAGNTVPSKVVSFTNNPMLQNTKSWLPSEFRSPHVALQCDEGPDYSSSRIGLFGLGKLHNIERSVASLRDGLIAANV